MHIPRWATPAAAVAASGVLLTGCGKVPAGQQANAGVGATQAAPDPARQDPSAEPSPTVTPPVLQAAGVSRLGKVVTDGAGRTLYRFDRDTARPPASTCMDSCAKTWPPVQATQGAVQVDGVDQRLVGKVKRPDGSWQVTLGGWPLYRYAKDESPGEVKGQGVGGAWFAAAPDGKKAAGGQRERQQDGGDDGDDGGRDRWAGWTVVNVRKDPRLGMIVTDGQGRVMYRFDKDRPKVTNCFGQCKKAWPVVKFTNWKKLKVEGVDRSRIGFIERKDDGSCQLTINGWPMYYFAKDEKPGDTKGQGVQNVWWVVSPQGAKITKSAGGSGY
ncbi:SCO0930 family lipoprotein [Actinomadura miaoliensis]|uniref:SCO0930 family lipoprotein n=1 Tax=Actinomadura miaoliensis TaxID=430685 RepID=A0ABP7WI56_9ACTN